MDPRMLVDPVFTESVPVPLWAEGVPAPLWFVQLFKVLGFSLHMVPMHLWFGGTILSMLMANYGGNTGRQVGRRLMSQMPIIVAMGINFGIVPLLFVQVAYTRLFYPATILMGWAWFAVIVLLIPAYYGVYLYAFGLKNGEATMRPWKRAAGWVSAGVFVLIGFFFASAMSLMANVESWPLLWADHSVAGAATGTAMNHSDPQLLPRWMMMFGLALTTVGAWTLLDAGWFAGREEPEYRREASRFAWNVYTLGMAWFAAFGSWYVFGTWNPQVRETMFSGPWVVLTAATALAPGLPWLLITYARARGREATRGLASLAFLAQFGVIGLNATSRQVVQNVEIQRYFDVMGQPTDVQWSPLAAFLLVFVAGLLVVVWMLSQLRHAKPAAGA